MLIFQIGCCALSDVDKNGEKLFNEQHVRASLVVRVAVAVGIHLPKHQTTPATADRSCDHNIPRFSLQPSLLPHCDLPLRANPSPSSAASLAAICTSRHSPHHPPANRWNATADSTRHSLPLYQTSQAQARCQTSYLQCSSLPPPVRILRTPRSPSRFALFLPSSRARVA